MSSSWDLAIVGAGPAGAASAIIAARAGLKVVVLDVAQFPRQKVCGEHLAPAAWQMLDELGAADLRAQAQPLTTMQLTAGETCRLTMDLGNELFAPRALSRYHLDARLLDLARQAGATILLGHRVRHIIAKDRRAAIVECAGRTDDETGERLSARLIVAADGRRSVVVRDTGRINRRDLGLFGFKRHLRCAAGSPSGIIAMHALAGGYVGTCSMEDGSLNVCGVMPRRLLQDARGDIERALKAWFADHSELREYAAAEGNQAWLSIADVSPQTSRPEIAGVLYVGDAQATIEPLSGQGMTIALESARLLGEWIRRHGVDGIDEQAQRSYVAAWHKKFSQQIRAATWFGCLLRRPTLLRTIIRASRPLPGLTDLLFQKAHRRTSESR